jgi:Fanconi-associated nuclease 1
MVTGLRVNNARHVPENRWMTSAFQQCTKQAITLLSYGTAKYNEMLERRFQHQDSNNYEYNDLPPAKRRKPVERTDTEEGSALDKSDSESISESLRTYREEIPDSQEEDDLDDDSDEHVRFSDQRPTELESALAPVKTDKEAITEYELMRAAGEVIATNLKERLDTRNWTKGRSSIYVDAFNLALETVLENESHLFDEVEIEVFNQWQALDYGAQYLSVAMWCY